VNEPIPIEQPKKFIFSIELKKDAEEEMKFMQKDIEPEQTVEKRQSRSR
jgi:hypothetical protein